MRGAVWKRIPSSRRESWQQTPGAQHSSNPSLPTTGTGITHDTIRQIVENPDSVPTAVLATVREMARQYRFFHWHLEFPGIFTVPGSDDCRN